MYLVQMVSSVCGANQVRSTKTSVSKTSVPTVKHGGRSVMVWGCIEGTMRVNMHCDLLKQSMIPSLRPSAGQYSNITSTGLLKKLRGKGDGLAKHVSRPKPY